MPLPTKNIDTGLGLERMAAIMQGVQSNYETDVMRDLIGVGERLSGKTYDGNMAPGAIPAEQAAADLSLRIIADHSRSVTFMIADGILPANDGRGYVLRRLLRHAVLHGHKLGIEGPFLCEYVDKIVHLMGKVYPEIVDNRETVESVIRSEEERFGRTLRDGLALLDGALKDKTEGATLAGDQAFVLHDTYGFPIELTKEICAERGIDVDEEGFAACMEEQRSRARAATKGDAEAAWSTYGSVHAEIFKEVGATRFVGYDHLVANATVVALLKDGQRVNALDMGDEGEVVLRETPFYAEMGGEVGDTGTLRTSDSFADVLDTKAPEKGLTSHLVKVISGRFLEGEQVTAEVDADRRARITRNHTATHILHAALRSVLGEHVNQAGSYVGPDRLRFDFTHFQAMTPEEVRAVEALANEKVMAAIPTHIYETSQDEARASGVTALFGEKYDDVVRVVEASDFSRELCGGCHVGNTAEIGLIKVTSESSVGANVRRIEAVTSHGALEYLNRIEDELRKTAEELRVPLFDVSSRTAANIRTIKDMEAKAKANKKRAAEDNIDEYLESVIDVGYPLFVARLDGLDTGGLRNTWDIVRSRMKRPGACVIGTVKDGRPTIMAAATDEAVAAGFDAGAVIKAISSHIQGGGGGKPTMAQAGGKNADGMDAALDAARTLLS